MAAHNLKSTPKQRILKEASPPVARKTKAMPARVATTAKFVTLVTGPRGNVTEVIRGMRQGMSADIVPQVAQRLGLSQEKLFENLRLPRSTMKARLGKNQSLSATEQDRMYRIGRVWDRAVDVLEDDEAARAWINRDNRSLGGESPLSLLDTEAGYELVLDTLGRIESGVVA